MKPYRSSRYLAWIRTLPCAVCKTDKYIEAAHTGPHGMSQKAPDTSAIPLCRKHHQFGNDSYHRLGPRKFSDTHKIDIPSIVRKLSAKPIIRVVGGHYYGYLDDYEYHLGTVTFGLRSAIRKILNHCREERRAS
jgi:hypothetical protein